MDPHLTASLVILLFISCAVAVISERLKQPYTIALVLSGLLVATSHLTPDIFISHDVIFTLILPPLLFHGAMHMDLGRLKENWQTIALLAIPGVIATTFLIGFILHKLLGLDLLYALLFGALITPTDPISVLAILKSVGAPRRLRTILEGESLFNDGTGVVIFSIVLGLLIGHTHFDFGESVWEFFRITGGGTVIGLALGGAAYLVLKRIDNHLHEVTITVALTFGTPLLAEHFHFSGIIAIVVAGLIIGNHGHILFLSEKTRLAIDHFWAVIEFIINSIVFLAIGLELQVIEVADLSSYWKPAGVAVGAVLLARAVVVYPIVWLKDRLGHDDVPLRWAHVLFWGGLKGVLSLALVVGLPKDMPHRFDFLVMGFAVVLFTLVVQGLTMKPLIKGLKISGE